MMAVGVRVVRAVHRGQLRTRDILGCRWYMCKCKPVGGEWYMVEGADLKLVLKWVS